MAPNFTQCSIDFLNSSVPYWNYTFKGTPNVIVQEEFTIFAGQSNRSVLISAYGCRHLCGIGNDFYTWKDASGTITTWVLPVIGLMLQAPFESNEFWKTLWALARWMGSPVASLSYILWNIRATGKCALMVDMATTYDEIPGQDTPFAQFRDSLYILSVMNQYTLKRAMPAAAAEKLLRIALFSDSLKLNAMEDRSRCLVKRRCELASLIRRGRKKGVVPVFISIMWFLFSLAISIQAAWGQFGGNAQAHDMALGFLLAWLPILILTSIVDRNPVAAYSIRMELNSLLDDVRWALLNPGLRDTFIRESGREPEDFVWTNALNDEDYFRQDFFTHFAGQGRVRWHYGVAHPILDGIERTFMAECGRNWLRDPERARSWMVLGPNRTAGLRWFDPRMIWQIVCSVGLVCGSVGGAFILSYFTPTVGLGCRSGGYLIFVVIALGVFVAELLICSFISESPRESTLTYPMAHLGSIFEHRLIRKSTIGSRVAGTAKDRLGSNLHWWSSLTLRDCMEIFILRPFEVGNLLWLTHIVLAQTFGFYQNCNFAEYCTQSHLSTDDYGAAMRGLRRTRCFKKYTYWARSIPQNLIELGKRICNKILGQRVSRERRSLVWTWKTKPLALPVNKMEESTVHEEEGEESIVREEEEEGRSQARSLLNGGETDSGDGDGEINAPANIPLRKVQSAPIMRIERSKIGRA
ncbi:hypothetical protein MMC07_009540 [Pseudocyphellaria aurata]|nr:hypothetical protein [Pseudocyphellaria aurata]